MTFTILGRDPNTGELGIGIATYSLAVGATCPKILPGIAVATTQASTNPAIAEEIMELIEDGDDPIEAFMKSLANDDHLEYRQVALLRPKGDPIIHSGANVKPHSGHINGDDCIAVGNFLANDQVLIKMAKAFEGPSSDKTLAGRILAALEAGKTAGGQANSAGESLPERSACLIIGAPGERFPIDIRVDVSNDPITELRTAYETYLPMHEFYLNRAGNPTTLPSQDQWLSNNP
ncbi:DUF1028 domain-containing protein [Dehalococcoides mccartyi]|nr:DUF1028 domain-containing protein [Dehalococcoides mccartyi]